MAEQETSTPQALPEIQKAPADAETYAEHVRIRKGEKVPLNLNQPVVEKPESSEQAEKASESAPAPEAATKKAPEEQEVTESKEEKEKQDKKPRRDRTAEGRISDLYARAKAAEEERDKLRRELESKQVTQPAAGAQPQPQPQQPRPPIPHPANDPPPNGGDFKDADGQPDVWAFMDARAAWATRQALREAEAARIVQRVQTETLGRLEKAAAKYPDYAEALNVDLTPTMQQYVLQKAHGFEVAYHLAKDPEAHARMISLSPLDQITELDRLADRYLTPPKEQTKEAAPVSRAPAPIRPISGTAPSTRHTSEAGSFKEHLALREAEYLKRRGR